ncbi:MAG: hemolysin family protein [Rikenellaceae bacterium]|nr:hemolysin family protein [Rikenellaceae bacterium]
MVSAAIIIITTLVFSAFFSGMEIAFVSSNKLKLEIEKKKNRTYNYIVDVFLKDPGQYITTILVGNNVALVIYSMSMSALLNALARRYGLQTGQGSVILETVISTIVIIFTAEFLPKAMFRNNANFFLRIFAVPVYLFYIVLYPVARFSTWLSKLLLRMVGLKVRPGESIRGFDRVDLEHLLEQVGESEEDNSEENEIKLFRNALDFSDLLVRDCMVPRVDIEAVDILCSVEELTRRFIETNYSRIFVYDGTIDNIIGYVNTKSLFTRPSSIQEILLDVDYVPESLSAQKLLSKLIKNKRAIAVVIDEYGGTAGVVSMEDVLEEIFGEIEDEHDSPDLVERVTAAGEYILSCRLEVDYLNEKYDLGIPESDQYETLAGYIIYYYEGIPARGEVIVRDGLEIRILRTGGSRLDLARIRKQ